MRCKAGPGHTAAESGPTPGVSEARVESEGQSVFPLNPLCLGSVHTHIHIHVHTARHSYFYLLQVTALQREKGPDHRCGERQVSQDVRPETESMGGPQGRVAIPPALRGSLVVSADIQI